MEEAKQKLVLYTDAYRTMSPFKEEYEQFLKSNRVELDFKQKNNKFGKVEGGQIIGRHLIEIPETLFTIFQMRLTPEELTWSNSIAGREWFGKTFPEFAASQV